MAKSVIKKLDKKFGGYDCLKRVRGYFDMADDLGWANEVDGLMNVLELYWIMNEELDNGGYFSDWKDLVYDNCKTWDEVVKMCADYNKRIGKDLFNAEELKDMYEWDD